MSAAASNSPEQPAAPQGILQGHLRQFAKIARAACWLEEGCGGFGLEDNGKRARFIIKGNPTWQKLDNVELLRVRDSKHERRRANFECRNLCCELPCCHVLRHANLHYRSLRSWQAPQHEGTFSKQRLYRFFAIVFDLYYRQALGSRSDRFAPVT
jgi:hypothetical protein